MLVRVPVPLPPHTGEPCHTFPCSCKLLLAAHFLLALASVIMQTRSGKHYALGTEHSERESDTAHSLPCSPRIPTRTTTPPSLPESQHYVIPTTEQVQSAIAAGKQLVVAYRPTAAGKRRCINALLSPPHSPLQRMHHNTPQIAGLDRI